MKFNLVDRIIEIEPGVRIATAKAVSLSEEYLADHFATFPVLPGVFMLEAMLESAAWLVRYTEGFVHSLILLKEARNVTYKSFVRPGNLLRIEVQCRRMARDESEFAGTGHCEDREVVRARFTLRHVLLSERDPRLAGNDARILAAVKQRWDLLTSDLKAAGAGLTGSRQAELVSPAAAGQD